MRVLITGVTGFIGRALSKELHDRNFDVYGLTRSDKFFKDIPTWFRPVSGDLMNLTSLEKALSESKPEVVVHLAAQTPVRFSFSDPLKYAQVNYLGTANLIEAVRTTRIEQFVHASTTEVYLSKDGLLKEDSPLFGGTPYGVSKAAADFYVQMAGRAWGLPYTVLRPCNTFGRQFELPQEARGYLVEKAVIQMLTQSKVLFDGSPSPKRCWMHVDDHVGAYLRVIGNAEAVGRVFNASANNPLRVGDVVSRIAELTGFNGEIFWNQNPRPYDPPSLCPDGSSLMGLGWIPKYSLEEGLRKTISYWKEKCEGRHSLALGGS